tara:strand:- start:44 stop:2110 length:2067 start_codon:yes stop_codon:yes gene_type:complete
MPDHYDEKDYEENRRSNRPKFGEREKFGTEFMDNLEQSAVGKFFDLSGERQAVLDQASREGKLGKVSQFTQKIEDKVGEVAAPVLKPVGAALGKISDVTQIDERISTPLTFVAAGAAAKGLSKIKPKHLGIKQTIEPYTPPKGLGKTPRKMVNVTNQVEEVFNMRPNKVQEIVRIAKKNKISYTKAEQYVNLKEKGIVPTQTINPGTNAGLIKSGEGPYDPGKDEVYIPPEERIGTQKGEPLKIDVGDTGFSGVKRGPKDEPYETFFNRTMINSGATYNSVGSIVMSSEAFKKLPSAIRREVAQMLLTNVNQGVKASFIYERLEKNAKLNKDLANYNKKYAARADLHHGYPSVIGIEFYLDIPFMEEQWFARQAIAEKYGNVPGQPMVKDKTNLYALPSGLPSTKKGVPIPEYVSAKQELEKVGRNIPKHIHQIIHNQFLANVMGQKGEKFWEVWDPIIDAKGEQGWLEAYEAFNILIAQNRKIFIEALSQLDILFSKNPLSANPEKLVSMLEEYLGTGKITLGSSTVLNKAGDLVMQPGTLGPKIVKYEQEAVRFVVEDALMDFKKAIRNERLTDPRFKDVANEIEAYPQLTDREKLRMEELLYLIRTYQGIAAKQGVRRAGYVTGITVTEHKNNLREFNNLSQLKIFNMPTDQRPKTSSFRKLRTTTHKDVKLNFNEEMQLILDLQ